MKVMTDMTGNFVFTFLVYTEYGEHSLRNLFKMIKKRLVQEATNLEHDLAEYLNQ